MTDDEIAVRIQADGLDNELKIRNREDLQVAIESLQLAARYQFDVDISEEDTGEEIQELLDYVERLEEELDGVEEDVGTLIEEVGDAVDEDAVEELSEQVVTLREKIEEPEEQPDREMKKSIAESKLEAKVRERGEVPSSWREVTKEVLEEMKEEGILSEDATIRTIEDYTKVLRRHLEESLSSDQGGNGDSESSSPTDEKKDLGEESGDKEDYTCSDCGKTFDSAVKTRETHHDCVSDSEKSEVSEDDELSSGEEECPHCGELFDPRGLNRHEPNCSENPENQEEEEQVDDSPDRGKEEGVYGLEWKTVDEAVQEYRRDGSKKHLLCIRSMSSFTSPTMAENHAEEDEGEVWAASEELPDDFVK